QRAGQAGLAVAEHAQGIAGIQPEGRIKRAVAEARRGIRPGGFKQEQGFDLAAGLVPYRQHGLPALALQRLPMRARRHAEGEDKGERQLCKARLHGVPDRPLTDGGSSASMMAPTLVDSCFLNNPSASLQSSHVKISYA